MAKGKIEALLKRVAGVSPRATKQDFEYFIRLVELAIHYFVTSDKDQIL